VEPDQLDSMPGRTLPHARGVEPAKVMVKLRDLPTRCLVAGGGVKAFLQEPRKTGGPQRQQPHRPATDPAHRVVHAINAGAGHDAENDEVFMCAESFSLPRFSKQAKAFRTMRILCIHAHFDDFEFVAGGTFELWRRKLGSELQAKVLVCTDCKAGTIFARARKRTDADRRTGSRGQDRAVPIRNCCVCPMASRRAKPVLRVTIDLLAALWKAIRDFEPDYVFCPPIPTDARAGIHVDHVSVAEAVRQVAYMINVPHAFTPEYPADETQSKPCRVPVIINGYDGYMFGANSHDLAVDVRNRLRDDLRPDMVSPVPDRGMAAVGRTAQHGATKNAGRLVGNVAPTVQPKKSGTGNRNPARDGSVHGNLVGRGAEF